MPKKQSIIAAGVLTGCLLCNAGISASAYTADDVAQRAREAGWPEHLIQSGYNEWASGDYTQDDLDGAYAGVQHYDEQTEEMICNAFGVPYEPKQDTGNQTGDADSSGNNPDTTNTPDSQGTSDNAGNAGDTGSSGMTGQPENNNNTGNPDTAGSQGNRIDSGTFVNMSLDEKIDYVNSLDESQRSSFLSGLSREERNSIIRQLPTEQKIYLMQNYIDTANSMGMRVVVDSLTEDTVSVTVRNDEGIIIDKASVGVVIDETGISHTKPLLVAGLGILISVAGFALLYWYSRKTE